MRLRLVMQNEEDAMRKRSAWSNAMRFLLLFLLLCSPALPLLAEGSANVQKKQDAASGKKKKDRASDKKKKVETPKKKKSDTPDLKEPDEELKESAGVKFVLKRYPSLRLGKVLRVDFHTKVQGDFRGFWPDLKTKEGQFDLHRARIGVEGRFLKHFEYEVERELRDVFQTFFEDAGGERDTKTTWRDAFVNFRYFDDFQIKAGKFKIPFGMEQLTGPMKLDYVFRSRISDNLAPARDIGVMMHGRFFKRRLSYEVGLFERDGENARTKENPGAERTIAGRVTGTPLRLVPILGFFKNLELGAAFTSSTVPEGQKALRGRTVSRQTIFPNKDQGIFVHGQRLRLGTEINWSPGPFSLKGEFIHVRDERRGQGLVGQDLLEMISRGWYLSGTWALTGEKKANGIEPRKEFLRGWGFGAIELAARYEQLRFGGGDPSRNPSRGSRAVNILGNSDRVWTFGINWYLNRWLKIQGNAVREKIEDTIRSPIFERERFWTGICRLQLVI